MGDMADQLEQKCEDASARYDELKAMTDRELTHALFEEMQSEDADVELNPVYYLRLKETLTVIDRERIIDFLTEENKF